MKMRTFAIGLLLVGCKRVTADSLHEEYLREEAARQKERATSVAAAEHAGNAKKNANEALRAQCGFDEKVSVVALDEGDIRRQCTNRLTQLDTTAKPSFDSTLGGDLIDLPQCKKVLRATIATARGKRKFHCLYDPIGASTVVAKYED